MSEITVESLSERLVELEKSKEVFVSFDELMLTDLEIIFIKRLLIEMKEK